MKIIENGVCAPLGFSANGVHAGIRKNKTKRDLALIYSEKKAIASCVYTTNLVKSAPIYVTKENVSDGYAQAIICNSGNANVYHQNAMNVSYGTCNALAKELQINPSDVIVASTGVIGQDLSLDPFIEAMPSLVKGLGNYSNLASEAIMTTDLVSKEIAVSFTLGGKECRMGGIAKGSGMIHPNMATMLVFITTDVSISKQMLQKALSEDVLDTFNMVSIDGDTSTNDMVSILANGMALNQEINSDNEDYQTFNNALNFITTTLCKKIASDGEGATKLITCNVSNAKTKEDARKVAKSVICSSLVKAAMFGSDANWGRIMCAIGYSNVLVNVNTIDIHLSSTKGKIKVCTNGAGIPFSEELAKVILLEKEVIIEINLNLGSENAVAWGCDLTYDYVKINGDYRS